MLKIGIIGGGTISEYHLPLYKANADCKVKSIADINVDIAKKRAEQYGIENYYSDYHEIINDPEIDAVCILSPTFTHKEIILEAIKNNKHIFCEKPPALNAEEIKECYEAAKNYDKCLMFGFVSRFSSNIQYMKKYINSGKMGKIVCVEISRLGRMLNKKGWFRSKKLGGGCLIDEAIHQLDAVLYLMDYPKPKSITAFSSMINNNLPRDINHLDIPGAKEIEKRPDADTESVIKAFINFENGANLVVKSSYVLNTFETGSYIEINGEKAGIRLDGELKILEVSDDLFLSERTPLLKKSNNFENETRHFVNCCLKKEKCITPITDAVKLMEIIDAIHKSAETGETILFT